MRTDCGKTKRTRRYFMNDAFIISSKFQNLFLFSKTLVRMFNGYPKSSARSRCHFHEKKKTIDKNLRKYLLTLYYISMCQERKEPLSNKQNHVFGRPNCSRFECVFVFQHISSNTPSKNNQTKKEKSKYYESSIAKDVRNSVCSTHFPSRKNFKISFVFSLDTRRTRKVSH